MKKVTLVVRTLLGVIFTVFGLNGFFHFLPMPPMPEQAGAFMGALAQTGYMFPLLFGFQTLGGLLLLTGCWVPLGLVILAPIVTNIILFHIAIAPAGLPMALFVVAAEGFLAWSYKDAFAPLFKRK